MCTLQCTNELKTEYEKQANVMKKASVIAAIIIALCMVLSSCNQHACPAYAKKDMEQSENRV